MEIASSEPIANEWEIPDPSILVRQGDLLVASDPTTRKISDICVVITADCDISKSKFGKQLACLKVITHEEYIKNLWAERKLESSIKIEVEKVQGKLNKWNKLRSGGGGEITAEATISWVQRAEPAEICEVLDIPDGSRKKEIAAIQSLKKGLDTLRLMSNSDKIIQAASFRAVTQGKPPETCFVEYLQQAQNEKLPEDLFFLPSLPQIKTSSAVVLLREVIGIDEAKICYRLSDASTLEMYFRIGRLKPTFKYAVSQAFGMLYTRIGLPSDFEDRCKVAASKINSLKWEATC